jgi:phage FluMu protein Com
MDAITKRSILIAVSIVCLGLASLIMFANRKPKAGALDSIRDEEMLWMKCVNKACGAEDQMSKKAYFKYIRDNIDPATFKPVPMVCEKCGQRSVYRAVKCANCQRVFFYGAVAADFEDRCPYCKYSETEELRKKKRAGE